MAKRKAADYDVLVAYSTSKSLAEAAEKTGVTRQRVQQKLVRIGVRGYIELFKRRRKLAEQAERTHWTRKCVRCGTEFGILPGESAGAFNRRPYCSRECAWRIITEGHESNPAGRERFTVEQLLNALLITRNIDEMARVLGVTRNAVLNKAGSLFVRHLWDEMDQVSR